MTERDFIWLGCINGRHAWRFAGGRNAACELGASCGCSVPVHECDCGDCDYGDNAEADEIRRRCAAARADAGGD